MKQIIPLCIFLISINLCNNKLSGQEIITDRPDLTESSSTIPKGSLQIESGLFLGFTSLDGISERQFIAPTTLFRYGVTKGIEIRVFNQLENNKNKMTSEVVSGISDLEVGAKFQLLRKENVNTEIGFISHLLIPTGSEELSNDDYGSINKLAFSHELGEKKGLGYNVGYNYFGSGKGDLTYSLAIAIKINKKAGFYVEPFGEFVEFKEHFSNIDAGLTYLLKDNFQLDFSFGTGINHYMNFISAGFSWNIGKD